MINIFIADSSYLAREGLKRIINCCNEFAFVGEIDDTLQLEEQLSELKPDVLILDHTSRLINLDDLGFIKNGLPSTKILAITPEQSKNVLIKTFDIGVTGYVLKDCSREEITDAIYATARGEKFFCTRVVDKLISETATPVEIDLPSEASCDPVKISDREQEIIKHIAGGLSNKQIADKLFLSTHTVNTHRKNIMHKLGVNNTAGLVIYAVKENLVNPDLFLFAASAQLN